ncbi:MAG: hypothetical protein U1F43_02330 [Myxococcota bacterium]
MLRSLAVAVVAVVAVVATLTVDPLTRAAAPADPALAAARTPLLGGRLSVRLAEGMKVEARGHSLMAADAAQEDETRAVVDKGDVRLVMMVWELYTRAGDDFAAAVKADLAAGGMAAPPALETPTVAAPLSALAVTPPPPSPPRDGNVIYEAYVKQADGTVELIAFYVSPEGLQDAARWVALARAVVGTLEAGKRALALGGGEVAFAGAGKDKLVLTLPPGFVTATQDGPDFSVYRIRQVVTLGQPQPLCGIYLGGHPSYQHSQRDIPADKVTTVMGVLIGVATAWHQWGDGGGTTTEAMVDHPLQPSLRVHAFCAAPTVAERDRLQQLVSTLRVVP